MIFDFNNAISEKTWKDRYQKNGESLQENFKRVAQFVANNKVEEEFFYEIMNQGLFFGGGRTTSNAGIGTKLTLNNCFCAPRIKDDLNDIFKKVNLGAITHQRGGGIGYDFSTLRPSGLKTSNDAIASGPVSFMDVFNAQTATILQGGRRGANMGILNIYHPDIKEFIEAKATDPKRLNHFNLSVMVDDNFLQSVEEDREILLHFPVYDDKGFIETNPSKWIVNKTVSARELWDLIIKKAYDNGEPGIFFYDNLNRRNNLAYCENIIITNPCSEYVSGIVYGDSYDSNNYGGACNLGSLMLHNFVVSPFTKEAHIDYELLTTTIRRAVTFLDNIIEKNKYPDDVFRNYQKEFRTIGLGVTGLADALAMLNLSYDSINGRKFVDKLIEYISLTAFSASVELAQVKGPFPGFKQEFADGGFLVEHANYSKYYKKEWQDLIDNIKESGIRNAKVMSIAPTGTMSLVFGNNCSSGIEPIFALEAKRKIKIGGQGEDNIQEVILQDYAYSLYKKLYNKEPPKSLFPTALEISVDSHLEMLGVIANHIDMSVSKTINIPESYSFEDTKDVYFKARNLGIKGCTIFRPNALRPGIIFDNTSSINTPPEKEDEKPIKYNYITPVSRKTLGTTHGNVYCKKCACGTLYITVACDDEGNLVETFVESSKGGVCKANTAAINRLVSLAMRSGVVVEEIIDQLKGIDCKACTTAKSNGKQIDGLSCPDIISKVIEEFYKDKNFPYLKDKKTPKEIEQERKELKNLITCPECGESIVFEGGCVICHSCGWSKCG